MAEGSAARERLLGRGAGREEVAVYDGSWTEWGSSADTPVATAAGS